MEKQGKALRLRGFVESDKKTLMKRLNGVGDYMLGGPLLVQLKTKALGCSWTKAACLITSSVERTE